MRHFFFAGNDELDLRRRLSPEVAFIGVGAPHVLHSLAAVVQRARVLQCTIADLNARQVEHVKTQIRTVIATATRQEYVRSMLAIEVPDEAFAALDAVTADHAAMRIRGSETGAALLDTERAFWRSVRTDVARFEELHGIRVRQQAEGLRCEIAVAPDAPPAQLIHVISCVPPVAAAFHGTLAFASGLLASDYAYESFRAALRVMAIEVVCCDVARLLDEGVANATRIPLVAYCSNIFHPFFIRRSGEMPKCLDRLLTAIRIVGTNVTIIADERESHALSATAAAALAATSNRL